MAWKRKKSTKFFVSIGSKLPRWWYRCCWETLEHLNLSLKVRVGQAGHHHHVLCQSRLPGLGPGSSSRALQTTRLLEPSVPHLDLLDLVTGLGKLRHEPGILHGWGDRIGTELLDVSVRKTALVWWRVFDEISLPVPCWESCVLG